MNSDNRKYFIIFVLVGVVLLSGCMGSGLFDDSSSDLQPVADTEGNTESPGEPNKTKEPSQNVDTSGDGLYDATADELGLNPQYQYNPQLVDALNITLEENEDAAKIIASAFTNSSQSVPSERKPALTNYTYLAEKHPEAISALAVNIIKGQSTSFIDNQLSVLVTLSEEDRQKVFNSYNLSNEDWSGSGLKNWEELKYGTNIFAADTSGDGIPDGLSVHHKEVYPGADPLQKDIYVEYNSDLGNSISSSDLKNIENKFAEAPIENVDGSTGINLHFIESGELDIGSAGKNGGDERKYRKFGYHYVKIVDPNELGHPDPDVNDPLGLYVGQQKSLVEDRRDTGSTLMHELGHSLGLIGMHGVDSEKVSFSNYESVMNYNAPYGFYGFSDSLKGPRAATDWDYIECKMAPIALEGAGSLDMEYFGDQAFAHNAARRQATPASECKFGFEITKAEYIYVQVDESHGDVKYSSPSELNSTIEESDSEREYKIIDEKNLNDKIEIEVTINNTATKRLSRQVRLKDIFTDMGTQNIDMTLESEENKTVQFEVDADVVDDLGSDSAGYRLKTGDDSTWITIVVIGRE